MSNLPSLKSEILDSSPVSILDFSTHNVWFEHLYGYYSLFNLRVSNMKLKKNIIAFT